MEDKEVKPKKVQKTQKEVEQETIRRNFTGSEEINSDLFKLMEAQFLKNISLDPNKAEYDRVTHVHHFHSYDSSGKKMDFCCAVGGHKHRVVVEYDTNNEIIGATCSPSGAKDDNHVHEVQYLRTNKVEQRVRNKEAIKLGSIHAKRSN